MKKISAIFILITSLFILGCAAEDTTGPLSGTVKDQDGNLLEGVLVVLENEQVYQMIFTTTEGKYEFIDLTPGTFNVSLERDGCETYTDELKVKKGTNFVMQCE